MRIDPGTSEPVALTVWKTDDGTLFQEYVGKYRVTNINSLWLGPEKNDTRFAYRDRVWLGSMHGDAIRVIALGDRCAIWTQSGMEGGIDEWYYYTYRPSTADPTINESYAIPHSQAADRSTLDVIKWVSESKYPELDFRLWMGAKK